MLLLPKMGFCHIFLKAAIRNVQEEDLHVAVLNFSCAGLVPTGKTITDPGQYAGKAGKLLLR